MFIFNITYLVPDKVYGRWAKWLREKNLPLMLRDELLSSPQLAKVFTNEDQDGESYSVQFRVASLELLEEWHIKFSKDFEKLVKDEFSNEVQFFATVLEVLNL